MNAQPLGWDDSFVGVERTVAVDHAPATVAARNRAAGRRFLVLDDDPTGSQAVHDLDVVTAIDPPAISRALAEPGSACFVLTNSRSLPADEARAVATALGGLAAEIEQAVGGRVEVVSRSDSTLRGHVFDEIDALAAQRRASGRDSVDGVLFAPAFFEAGRFTAADVHWARVSGEVVAAAETEFARDRTFGYTRSDLPGFLAEASGGAIDADQVVTISLEDIRAGGPGRVTQLLAAVRDGQWVGVNGTTYEDFDVVALAVADAQAQGRRFLFRTGPSFVRSIVGLGPKAPLATGDLFPDGAPAGHGLLVVGSHVGQTTRQVEALESLGGIEKIEVDAARLAAGSTRYVTELGAAASDALARGDVLVMTSRSLVTGAGANEQLAISRAISAGLVSIAEAVLARRPGWVVAKGGITSHDVLAGAMQVRRAKIVGQLFPGQVSVFAPVEVGAGGTTVPCAIFPGNVGSDRSLAEAVQIFRGGTR